MLVYYMSFVSRQLVFHNTRFLSAVIRRRNRTKWHRPLTMKFPCLEDCNIRISSNVWVRQNTQDTSTSSWSGCQVWSNLLIKSFQVSSTWIKPLLENSVSNGCAWSWNNFAFLPSGWDSRPFQVTHSILLLLRVFSFTFHPPLGSDEPVTCPGNHKEGKTETFNGRTTCFGIFFKRIYLELRMVIASLHT